MRLHTLQKIKGERHSKKRLGCGPGSGHGKTSGRGHKGGKARSGYSVRPGYEGGQMPLYRRLPHRGFNNAEFTIRYEVVNLSQIDQIEGIDMIDRDVLVHSGLLRSNTIRYKILAEGALTKPLTIKADKFSEAAKLKIEASGGKVEFVS
jgi:large subunit ribosomal protein L15